MSDHEVVKMRDALGRVLAQDIVPQINVPAHDNSAMDGYAVRFSDLQDKPAEGNRHRARRQAVRRQARRGRMRAHHDRRGDAAGRRHRGDPGSREEAKASASRIPPGQKRAQNVRYAGEDLKIGKAVLASGKLLQARRTSA